MAFERNLQAVMAYHRKVGQQGTVDPVIWHVIEADPPVMIELPFYGEASQGLCLLG